MSKKDRKKLISAIAILVIAFIVVLSSNTKNYESKTNYNQSSTTSQTKVNNEKSYQDSLNKELKKSDDKPVEIDKKSKDYSPVHSNDSFSITNVPKYSGNASIKVNNNKPYFTKDEIIDISYEKYSALDKLGRCGVATACVGQDIMPTEKRGDIGKVKPTGWQVAKYPGFVDGNYLYNRCHLIGYQLTGENANWNNLITGTRYLNVDGMLPYEDLVAEYVKRTNHHVMYRVTPIFTSDNLIADGVLIEGQSVEDNNVSFCIFCYNVQPGISIDYKTGDSHLVNDTKKETEETYEMVWIPKSGKRYHKISTCSGMNSAKQISEDQAINKGYKKCDICF